MNPNNVLYNCPHAPQGRPPSSPGARWQQTSQATISNSRGPVQWDTGWRHTQVQLVPPTMHFSNAPSSGSRSDFPLPHCGASAWAIAVPGAAHSNEVCSCPAAHASAAAAATSSSTAVKALIPPFCCDGTSYSRHSLLSDRKHHERTNSPQRTNGPQKQ